MVTSLTSTVATWYAPQACTETYRLLVDDATGPRFLPYLGMNLSYIVLSAGGLVRAALISASAVRTPFNTSLIKS
jgi:hypothetical protein